MLTQERVRKLLVYDHRLGTFVWREHGSRGRATVSGKSAGTVNRDGYLRICIDETHYGAHRVAWLYVNGELPEYLDHIDGDKSNNRLANLRPATKSDNCFNWQRERPTGRDLPRGVYKQQTRHGKDSTRYKAKIVKDSRTYYLGYFDTVEQAKRAYDDKARELYGDVASTYLERSTTRGKPRRAKRPEAPGTLIES